MRRTQGKKKTIPMEDYPNPKAEEDAVPNQLSNKLRRNASDTSSWNQYFQNPGVKRKLYQITN
jgi:hypothetical protein